MTLGLKDYSILSECSLVLMTMTNPDFNFPRKSLLNFAITIIKNHGAITRKLLIQSEKCSLGAGIKIYMGNVKLSSLQQLCT